jgi:hypothetical protein
MISFLGLSLAAFKAPEVDGFVELQGHFFARTSASFGNIDQNRIAVLKPGTRGKIVKIENLSSRNDNLGLCIQVSEGERQPYGVDCVWVHYNPQQKFMAFEASAPQRKTTRGVRVATPAPTSAQEPEVGTTVRILKRITGFFQMGTAQAAEAPAALPGAPTASQAADRNKGQLALQKTETTVPLMPEPKSIDQDALNRLSLDYIKNINKGVGAVSAPATCTDCRTESIRAFETCTSRNGYMESELADLFGQESQLSALVMTTPIRPLIKPSCIQNSLASYGVPARSYAYCPSAQGNASNKRGVGRACVSENYSRVVSNSFNHVARCMGEYLTGDKSFDSSTAIKMFGLMAHESGLHTNAVSDTGAGGSGQFTQGAIENVNKNEFSDVLTHLRSSKDQACQSIAQILEQNRMKDSSSQSCSRISTKAGNPIVNMVYTFANMKTTRDYLDNQTWEGASMFQTVLSEMQESQNKAEFEELKQLVAMWGHNSGSAGIKVPLEKTLRDWKRKRKVITARNKAQFINDLQSNVRNFPHSANSSNARRNETSIFLNRVLERLNAIETTGGGSCAG